MRCDRNLGFLLLACTARAASVWSADTPIDHPHSANSEVAPLLAEMARLLMPMMSRSSPNGTADGQYRGAYSTVPHMTFVPISDSLDFILVDQPTQFESALDAFLAN